MSRFSSDDIDAALELVDAAPSHLVARLAHFGLPAESIVRYARIHSAGLGEVLATVDTAEAHSLGWLDGLVVGLALASGASLDS